MCCAVTADIVVVIHWQFLCSSSSSSCFGNFLYKVVTVSADNAAAAAAC